MYSGFHVKFPLFLLDLNEAWIFLTDLKKKKRKHKIRQKSVPWELSCSVWMDRHTERQTDMIKLNIHFL
jgi:hypothetical protein